MFPPDRLYSPLLSKLLPRLTTEGGGGQKLNNLHPSNQSVVCLPSINQLEQTGYKGRENDWLCFRCILFGKNILYFEPFWMWFFLSLLFLLPFSKQQSLLNARLKQRIQFIRSNFLKASCTNGVHIYVLKQGKQMSVANISESTCLKGRREKIVKFLALPVSRCPRVVRQGDKSQVTFVFARYIFSGHTLFLCQ